MKRNMEDVLLYLSVKHEGDFGKIYKAIENKENIDMEKLEQIKKDMKSEYTTIISEDYPECLKSMPCPPFVLYYYGDLSLISRTCIGITGTNKPSEYGKDITAYFAEGLARNGIVTVGGLAKGIETAAHKATIENGGKTVAVLGCGIDCCYPKENKELYEEIKKNHLLISEYPFEYGTGSTFNLTARKRLIAGFSDSILIPECRVKGGTMITIGFALEQGKDIYAAPSSILSEHTGTNVLIREGATVVNDLDDLLSEIDYDREENIEQYE